MRIRRLDEADAELIRSTITHPRVWPMASDDGCPPASEYLPPVENRNLFYLGVFAPDGHYLGLFRVDPMNAITGNMHVCILPAAYGQAAIDAARAAFQWVWDNTHLKRLVAMIPAFNRLAIRYAEKCGMEWFGTNPQSWAKDGMVWDTVFLGLSKPNGGE